MGFLSGSVDAVDDTLGGRYDEVEDVDAEDVEVVRLGALMDASGADASLIVSSSSSAWLNTYFSYESRRAMYAIPFVFRNLSPIFGQIDPLGGGKRDSGEQVHRQSLEVPAAPAKS